MKLIDLIAAIGGDPESEDKIQICHPGRNWDNYDTFNAGIEKISRIGRRK